VPRLRKLDLVFSSALRRVILELFANVSHERDHTLKLDAAFSVK